MVISCTCEVTRQLCFTRSWNLVEMGSLILHSMWVLHVSLMYIDILFRGSNFVRGTLNWGITSFLNAGWRTFGFWTDRRQSFADDFHVYSLEWTPDFM